MHKNTLMQEYDPQNVHFTTSGSRGAAQTGHDSANSCGMRGYAPEENVDPASLWGKIPHHAPRVVAPCAFISLASEGRRQNRHGRGPVRVEMSISPHVAEAPIPYPQTRRATMPSGPRLTASGVGCPLPAWSREA